MNQKLENKNGITLIALVVTIVVLLILAGVSISLILDNNGIIQRSKDAKREYGQARENEQADLNNASSWIDSVVNEPEIVEPEDIKEWIYTEEDDGTITLNCYKGKNTKVIIPNSVNGKSVKIVKNKTYAHIYMKILDTIWSRDICSDETIRGYYQLQKTIKEVAITKGVEEIGEFAFVGSSVLNKITVPDSVTIIGRQAFADCTALSNIVIPNHTISIGDEAFYNCISLADIIIPESVTSIGDGAFEDCTSLTNITIPESVTIMGQGVFYGIPSITVSVPFKEGEKTEGWNENWNSTDNDCTITINYAK